MAISANRVKNTSSLVELIRLALIVLKRFFVLFFIIASLYLFVSTPKKLSSISLEIIGYFVTTGLLIYEDVFKHINWVTQKFIYLQDLAKENIELKSEIARLQRQQIDIDLIKSENIALKNLLLVVEEEQYSYVTAKLLSVSLNPYSKTALVAAGANHGVEVNQVVTNNYGLVGRVMQVSNNYSKIMLVNDANSRIPITTVSSRERGILTGNRKSSKILYLQKNHLVQNGEQVVTSGYGNIYPPGITVGYVKKIKGADVIVKPLINLSKTEFVKIMLPNQDQD